MQYGIMLIAKYWNRLWKFHSLCRLGEYSDIFICSFPRYAVAHAAFHNAHFLYLVYKYNIRKVEGMQEIHTEFDFQRRLIFTSGKVGMTD